ncbi:MAG: excinuclease ABC subunit UvrA [Salinivirgaceae bacterium]|nr:excinuclease ABC subunit UvrA [Salinivirgaceae bacterium]
MEYKDGKIEVSGAKVHNLKNISISLPRDQFIVITGVSGSGKSSLAFDTLYAEGQRRYVESLSSYARQFLGRINKPAVDSIRGIPPAIAIEQKVTSNNPRSTVGTSTEIYEYIRLLFARIGKTFSPISKKEVTQHSVTDVVNFLTSLPEGTRAMILSPLEITDSVQDLNSIKARGYQRVLANGTTFQVHDLSSLNEIIDKNPFYIVIDRITSSTDKDNMARMADSIQTAFFEGHGRCAIYDPKEDQYHDFSDLFELDGIQFELPTEHLFSFNNPLGACPRCDGNGQTVGIDENLVIPDKSLSIYQHAIACWRGEKMSEWNNALINNAIKFDFPIHKPYFDLSIEHRRLLWSGNEYFKGLNDFFAMLEENLYKIQYRVMLSRYRGKTICPECFGSRLRKEVHYVQIDGFSLPQLVDMPISELANFFDNIKLSKYDKAVADRILIEIKNRIHFLREVGLGYLTLNRRADTLSGGEAQRIRISTSLGSNLMGALYILDEPSIGLHSRDTHLLIGVLQRLRNMGNTVLVVEHDEDIMRASDYMIDIGPGAGTLGGEVVFAGTKDDLMNSPNSLTARYLLGKEELEIPKIRRPFKNKIKIIGARQNNLKGFDVEIPLNVLTVITGVSGSGKSSLIKSILVPALQLAYNGHTELIGEHIRIEGDIKSHKRIEFVDQNPIGRSSRSNPVTYVKAYDEIRKLFSEQQLSKQLKLKPSHFSFNVDGGRCEKCQGEGTTTVSMQFMADVQLICEECNGKRFKDDILEVKYQGKSIHDVLELTVSEAIAFFSNDIDPTAKKIVTKMQPLADVGLDYVHLGQSSSTLSGGESQRVKLATFLGKESSSESIIFVFDEPTTGLHFNDVRKLLASFEALIKHGHSIVVVEHNLDVIKSADWIVDLGPEGGDKGGNIVVCGTPEEVVKCKNSYTGKFLKRKLKPHVET